MDFTPPEEHAPSNARKRKRGQLDLVKCERCRADKVKCAPTLREWPAKCERCSAKGFPCSEGTRVERSSKNKPQASRSILKETTGKSETSSDNISWSDVQLLSMYHKNLTSALIHLEKMKRDTKAPFFNESQRAENTELGEEQLTGLKDMYEEIECTLLQTTSALAATNSTMPPGLPLAVLLAPILATESLTDKCPVCEPRIQTKIVNALSQENEFCIELLVRQSRLVKHCEVFESNPHFDEILFDPEIRSYVKLSAVFPLQALLRFKSLGMLKSAALSQEFRIYHPDTIGSYMFELGEEQQDCLGRTTLHCWLDYSVPDTSLEDMEQLEPEIRIWETVNEQDILGRTPLHITCQHGWLEAVKALLKLGADIETTTIYESTPLHYAAVRGSLEICVKLLSEGMKYGNDQLVAVDCEKYTARDYAIKNGHWGVANTLAREHSRTLFYGSIDNYPAEDSSRCGTSPKPSAPTLAVAPSFNLVVESYPQHPVPSAVIASNEVSESRQASLKTRWIKTAPRILRGPVTQSRHSRR